MIRMLIKNWWLLFLRGVLAIAFAVFIFALLPFIPAPLLRELAFAGLVTIFALFAIMTGTLTIAAAVRGAGRGNSSWLMLGEGVCLTAGGLIIFLSPDLTLIHVIQFIGGTVLLLGIQEVVAGIHLRRHLADEWLLICGGVISFVFGACLLLIKGASTQNVLTWLSLYAFASGVAIVGLALRLRRVQDAIHLTAARTKAQASTT